jgi:hypothetical protein
MVTVMDCSFLYERATGFWRPYFILNVKCNEAVMTAVSRLLVLVCKQLCIVQYIQSNTILKVMFVSDNFTCSSSQQSPENCWS